MFRHLTGREPTPEEIEEHRQEMADRRAQRVAAKERKEHKDPARGPCAGHQVRMVGSQNYLERTIMAEETLMARTDYTTGKQTEESGEIC